MPISTTFTREITWRFSSMPTNDVKLVLFYTNGPKPTCVGETGGGNSSRRPMDDMYICTSVRTGGRPKTRRIRTRKSTCCVQYAIVANILRQKPPGEGEPGGHVIVRYKSSGHYEGTTIQCSRPISEIGRRTFRAHTIEWWLRNTIIYRPTILRKRTTAQSIVSNRAKTILCWACENRRGNTLKRANSQDNRPVFSPHIRPWGRSIRKKRVPPL